MKDAPERRRLVLVGGGHAHVLVLEAFQKRRPAADVVVVSREAMTPYSGMLPGHIAGFYGREDMHIDLVRLTRRAGARLVQDEAVGFDRAGRRVLLKTGEAIPYDLLSIDIGITPHLSRIAGAERAIAVKPIGLFLDKWEDLKARALVAGGPRRIAVVGGGIAGICLAFAARAALRSGAGERGLDPAAFGFSLVSAEAPPELNGGMRRRVVAALAKRGIAVHAGETAVAVEPDAVRLASGGTVAADAVLISTAAAPAPALRASGFATDPRGFLAIRPTLQLLDDDDVFAAGDCATILEHPRPKAGVYAVRQGPVLACNLMHRLNGEPLESPVPQSKHLVLIGTGDGGAIGGRGSWLTFEGRAAWQLKDWIDRRFMRRFA
jgi:selenide,water dikinase